MTSISICTIANFVFVLAPAAWYSAQKVFRERKARVSIYEYRGMFIKSVLAWLIDEFAFPCTRSNRKIVIEKKKIGRGFPKYKVTSCLCNQMIYQS